MLLSSDLLDYVDMHFAPLKRELDVAVHEEDNRLVECPLHL